MGHKRDRNKPKEPEVIPTSREKALAMMKEQGFAVESMTEYQICSLIALARIEVTIEEGFKEMAALLDEYLFDIDDTGPQI